MRTHILSRGIGWLAALLVCLEAAAAEVRELSIPEFVAAQREWSRWVGEPLRIEGRYSSFTRNAMQFQKCSLFFYLPANAIRPTGRSRALEVTGQLREDRNGIGFQVESMRLLPEDGELFHLRRRALPADDPSAWYELGKRTVQRGEFYEDVLLAKLGQETLREGLALEQSLEPAPTVNSLRKLVVKAVELGLADEVRLSLLHESFRLAWEQGRARPEFDLAELLKQLGEELPGSLMMLPEAKSPLLKQYQEDPVATYRQATEQGRNQLGRLFYLEVVREEYERKLAASGANGEQIASDYAKLAPDDPETADDFRERALMFRTKNIATARRAELMAVVQEYRRQGQLEMAATAQKTWLGQRVSQLDKAGPSDYAQLARDYDDWLGNRPRAEQILLEGIRRFPDDLGLKTALQEREFVQDKGEWVRRDAVARQPVNPMQQAAQSGRVLPGMSPEQVVAALGAPQSQTRIASASETLLIWNYPESRLAIQFQQRRERQDFIVSAIHPLGR
ncbi:MAG: hypothetical protein R3C12_23080 [Planctomycetaceae bacterium]|nr:hypothetical protein [Planctomycetaceae bacterium]